MRQRFANRNDKLNSHASEREPGSSESSGATVDIQDNRTLISHYQEPSAELK